MNIMKIKQKEKKLKLSPIYNINRVLLLSVASFFIVGIIAGNIIPKITTNREHAMWLLEITTYLALGLPTLIFSKLQCNGSKDVILPKINITTIKDGLICGLIAYPLMLIAISLTKSADIASKMTSEQIESSLIGFSFIGNIFRLALLPALIEELVFRCGLFGVYSKKNVLVGIFISSIMFALLHGNLYQIPYAFVGGIIFAYAMYETENSGTAVIGHFVVNLISVFSSYLKRYINPEKIRTVENTIVGLLMAGGVLIGGYIFYKIFQKKIVAKPIKVKEDGISIGDCITLPLLFTISILLLLTLTYEGYTT